MKLVFVWREGKAVSPDGICAYRIIEGWLASGVPMAQALTS